MRSRIDEHEPVRALPRASSSSWQSRLQAGHERRRVRRAWSGIWTGAWPAWTVMDSARHRFGPQDALAEASARVRAARLLVKDETGNVSGSHKARHLMQVILWLESAGASDCGRTNADTARSPSPAAATRRWPPRSWRARWGVACSVFVPPDATRRRFSNACANSKRRSGLSARRGRAATRAAQRFQDAVQGRSAALRRARARRTDLTVEGGLTLGYEAVAQLRAHRRRVRHVVVQVGGGALASSCFQAFVRRTALGLLGELCHACMPFRPSRSPSAATCLRGVGRERLGSAGARFRRANSQRALARELAYASNAPWRSSCGPGSQPPELRHRHPRRRDLRLAGRGEGDARGAAAIRWRQRDDPRGTRPGRATHAIPGRHWSTAGLAGLMASRLIGA